MTTRRAIRKVAIVATIILLLGQTIAAAHFHHLSIDKEFGSAVASAATDGACAICAAQLHAPVVSAVAPALVVPEPMKRPVSYTARTEPLAPSIINVFGRAPPQLA